MLLLTNTGNYPRPKSLRVAISSIRGKQKDDFLTPELDEAYKKATEEVIREQMDCGIDLPTDGQQRWDDFLAYCALCLENVKMNGIIRFFDNNNYYRQPIIQGELSLKEDLLLRDFKFAKSICSKIKPVVTGPYTLAYMSKDKYYGDFEKVVMKLAEIFNFVLKELQSNGATVIQVDEPAIVYDENVDVALAKKAFRALRKDVNCEVGICTYFGSIENVYPDILDFNADFIGIDLPSSGVDVLKNDFGDIIALGCVDARTTKMENVNEIVAIVKKLSAEKIYLQPNCGLEFLPRIKAKEKLLLLKKVEERIANV